MLHYGEALKYQREMSGLTQFELSQKIAVSPQSISRWEVGNVSPCLYCCVQLADFYGITLDELIGREVKNKME